MGEKIAIFKGVIYGVALLGSFDRNLQIFVDIQILISFQEKLWVILYVWCWQYLGKNQG